jgi:hypothetical protein
MCLTAGPDVVTKRGTAIPTYNRNAAPLHPTSLLARFPRSIQKCLTQLAEIDSEVTEIYRYLFLDIRNETTENGYVTLRYVRYWRVE